MPTADARTFFNELGTFIEARWAATYFDEEALPDIAVAALSEYPPHESVTDEDIARWMVTSPSLGLQPNADFDFGEPPVTVFTGRRFYIEALYWIDGSPAIHQHDFDGAFCVLGGGSVHSTYSFSEGDRLSSRMLLGDVKHLHSEILRPGAVRAIRSGRRFIHSIFHFKRPSVSVVVRTFRRPGAEVQYTYDPPYVGLTPFDTDVWTRRAKDFVNLAVTCGWRSSADLARAAVRNADDLGAYQILRELSVRVAPLADAQDLDTASSAPLRAAHEAATEAAQEKFGSYAPAMLSSCEAKRRSMDIVGARQRVSGEVHRQFLAILMNVPDRARILDLVREHFPGMAAEERVGEWLRELTTSSTVLDYELGDDVISLAKCMLSGDRMERVLDRFAELRGRKLSDTDVRALRSAAALLRETPLVRPLFTDSVDAPYSEMKGAKVR